MKTTFARTQLLKSFSIGEWFSPTNLNENNYLMCNELFESGEIERKIEPIFIEGRFKGNKVYFKLSA